MRTFGYSDFWFILEAAQWTVLLSLRACVAGGIVGLSIAQSRTCENNSGRGLSVGCIQLLRGTPLLLHLFQVFFGAPGLGLIINPWLAPAVALALNSGEFL